ncbi:(2Fe-2S)-binding protein [Alteromonas sp. a30]|uniref:(2Fe-2S)-binding protein n=1 Tax=Alteromonas sp. a30 TaxID=2730917 RepID=UPI002280FD39|nr:(2Fe-2S)-binding protein [Alteromonas sp. a30]MCY7293925.1 (2Fe-2S)-binding protein [Alteromonas sp. a30]
MLNFTLNNKKVSVDTDENMPLLWVLRDVLGETGTKYSCGQGLCGACTVHLDGQPVRACVLPISTVANKRITTIEGLSEDASHPVQKAWAEHKVPQCGYCQSGQMMSAAALLQQNSNPSEDEINQFMDGNICRCGTYPRIKAAIKSAAKMLRSDSSQANLGVHIQQVGDEV